jgi:two-component system cell cycle sensor histidine kinase/response regulator CckA
MSAGEEVLDGVQSPVRDSAERRQADDALRASEARFRSLSAASPVGIYESDTDGAITYGNPQVLRIFGLSEADAMGHGWLARLHPDDVEPVTTGWAAALREQREYAHEYRLVMTDGTIRWVNCRSAPLHDGEGRMVGNVGTIEDITLRKELEAQLRQSQKMEAVGQLAGGVAHDFNNLLTVIKMNVELALEDLGAEHPLHADILEVARAAGRAAALTRQLLAFSRQQVLQPQVIDLNVVIADLQKMLARLIGEDIDFTLDLADDLGFVLADPGQLEQVLVNLAINARDAMPRGGSLTIATRNVELSPLEASRHPDARPGPYVAVALRDTGAGMTPDVQARIFEPFFTTKELGKGTGLGLATVYGIVTQSGGFLDVKSAPGRGAVFTVYLSAVSSGGEAPARSVAAAAERAGGTETILLVEDEDAVRAVARRVLTKYGYSVIEARDGGQALAFLGTHDGAIDLVLTDAVMPQMSGLELAAALGTLRPSLPVIVMSGYTDVDLVRRGALDSGAPILTKPFTVESLLTAVRAPLDRAKRSGDRPA